MCQAARKILSKNIKKYREKAKLTKEELSLSIGFDNSYISKLEKEKINTSIDTLEKIAKILNIHIKNLFE
ncbi:MAG: helix-turn-helix transcriptional regulator [Candidatus Gastranaerophilales bacterium]|nr:helix-turn-helix transcriptional regulator [Candidatus Gastranaerophilales bacterium]